MGLTRGKRRMVLRDKLEDAERDRADLIACLRELVAQIEAFDPDGCKPEQVYGGRVAHARALLARLEKGERPWPA